MEGGECVVEIELDPAVDAEETPSTPETSAESAESAESAQPALPAEQLNNSLDDFESPKKVKVPNELWQRFLQLSYDMQCMYFRDYLQSKDKGARNIIYPDWFVGDKQIVKNVKSTFRKAIRNYSLSTSGNLWYTIKGKFFFLSISTCVENHIESHPEFLDNLFSAFSNYFFWVENCSRSIEKLALKIENFFSTKLKNNVGCVVKSNWV